MADVLGCRGQPLPSPEALLRGTVQSTTGTPIRHCNRPDTSPPERRSRSLSGSRPFSTAARPRRRHNLTLVRLTRKQAPCQVPTATHRARRAARRQSAGPDHGITWPLSPLPSPLSLPAEVLNKPLRRRRVRARGPLQTIQKINQRRPLPLQQLNLLRLPRHPSPQSPLTLHQRPASAKPKKNSSHAPPHRLRICSEPQSVHSSHSSRGLSRDGILEHD